MTIYLCIFCMSSNKNRNPSYHFSQSLLSSSKILESFASQHSPLAFELAKWECSASGFVLRYIDSQTAVNYVCCWKDSHIFAANGGHRSFTGGSGEIIRRLQVPCTGFAIVLLLLFLNICLIALQPTLLSCQIPAHFPYHS